MADFVPVEHQLVVRSLIGGAYGGATADRLAATTRELFFPAGKVIFEAGDAPRFVFFIVEGRVELGGDDVEPWLFEGQGVFGILDVELERAHARTASAVTDVRVIAIRAEDWHEIVEDTFDYTRQRLTSNTVDLVRRGLALAPHAGFEGVPVAHRADAVPPRLPNAEEAPFERLLVLHLTDVFHRARIQALTRLAKGAHVLVLEEGQEIVRRGEPAGSVYAVAEGVVKIEREEPAISVPFGVHRLVGGYAGIGQQSWPFTLRAAEPSRVIAITVEDLFDVMEDHYDVVRSVMSFLAAERERLQTLRW